MKGGDRRMQTVELNGTLRVLKPANPDNWLTNGRTYSREVYLGLNANSDDWTEISQEQYEKETESPAG